MHFTGTTVVVSWRWSTYLQIVMATRGKGPRFKFAATAYSLNLFSQIIEKLFLILWMCFRCNTQSSACPDIQTHMKRLYFHRLEDPNVSLPGWSPFLWLNNFRFSDFVNTYIDTSSQGALKKNAVPDSSEGVSWLLVEMNMGLNPIEMRLGWGTPTLPLFSLLT